MTTHLIVYDSTQRTYLQKDSSKYRFSTFPFKVISQYKMAQQPKC